LFHAKEEVSRTEWRQYVDALQLDEDHPGILGLGFAARMTPAEKVSSTRRIRAEGFPDYHVVPVGDREAYAPLIYVEPFNWRNQRAFGYDLYAEPVRRATPDWARDQGTFTISGAVTLVQETNRGKQSGILLLLPV
jgi:two-component system cell cycle sensor histidine kinase/response regulator CckA